MWCECIKSQLKDMSEQEKTLIAWDVCTEAGVLSVMENEIRKST